MEIWVSIVLPIICSLIGGFLALVGVLITIKYENKKNNEMIKLSNKPIFYRIDPMQEYDYNKAVNFYFNSKSTVKVTTICGIFKNTDNAIMILDKVVVGKKEYYPVYGNVVDKNGIFNIEIYLCDNLKSDDDIVLCVKDVFNNEYNYKLKYELGSNSNRITITNFIEI